VDYTAITTTADNGRYSFDHLFYMPNNQYTITVNPATLPSGAGNWNETFDIDGISSANTATGSLPAPQNPGDAPDNPDFDFGYTGTGSLGDTVWYDLNDNGVQETSELGLTGVTVTISADIDNDGINEYTNTTITDSNGNYFFDNLPAANYTVSVTTGLPGGATPTYDLDSATTSPDSTTVFTLATGENTTLVDFGYTGTGTIGDTVWNDIDGDGIQDTGENGFAGITITLTGDLDQDGTADDTITTHTDSNGHYSFNNLFLGDYTVAVDPSTLPPGNGQTHDLDDPQTTTPTTPNITNVTLDTARPINNDVDFGYNSKGTIGDTIWYDADNDSSQDPSERGLAGVTVTLTGDMDGDGTQDTAIVTTDADGHYLFNQLQAGDYTITINNLPAGMIQTADPDGTNNNTTTLTLADGETNLNQDFGYTGTGTIGDTIWSDANGDGVQNNGETGLSGITVTLTTDLNHDGAIDTITTITDTNGNYHFNHLPADNYTITVDATTLPSGMLQTADPDGVNDNNTTVALAAGETNNNQDFGYQQTGTIGDTIWFDTDGNGIQDPGELGLANIKVTLVGDLDNDGQTDDTLSLITDANGNYLFDELPAGTYAISVDPSTLPDGMTETFDLDGTGSANTAQITISGNEANLDVDFGYKGTGSIGDTIWFDADNDGIQDPDETGIPGVSVTITGDFDNDGQLDDTMTVTTGANGKYIFPNLPAGEYNITVDPLTLPGGMNPTDDPDGTLDNTTHLNLNADEINLDQDFGYTGAGSIGDTIWQDFNRNGIQETGEPGIAGITIILQGDFDNNGSVNYSTSMVTDANGHYLFSNLPAGSYSLSLDPTTLPSSMNQTADPDSILDGFSQLTLSGGENNLNQDFGYAYPPSPVIPPEPFSPEIPPQPAISGLNIDSFFMYRQFNDNAVLLFPEQDIDYTLPPVPVAPIYTGHAEPGTTLSLTLYDTEGNPVGYQSIMADAAGNWLASFPGSILSDLPHHMAIEQTIASYNTSTNGFFNTRTYFNPSFANMIFASTRLDVETVFAYLPTTVLNSMHINDSNGLTLHWNDFTGYEFLSPSINPAQLSH